MKQISLTAFHEAGHAVVGLLHGGQPITIELDPAGRDDLYGICRWLYLPDDGRIPTAVAGYLADTIYRGCRPSIKSFAYICDIEGLDPIECRSQHDHVLKLLRANWSEVQRLAEQLEQEKIVWFIHR